jgi:hypothetical protein
MKKITIFTLFAALISFSSCEEEEVAVLGCTDMNATNYNSSATQNDGSCVYIVPGCTDATATNFNASANQDDGSCTFLGEAFTGSFTVTEACDQTGDYDYEQLITSNGNSITLVNAFAWSSSDDGTNNVTIELTSESFNITNYEAQLVNQQGAIVPCSYDIQGQLQGGNVIMAYTIYIDEDGSGFTEFDSCVATMTLITGGIISPTNPKSINL